MKYNSKHRYWSCKTTTVYLYITLHYINFIYQSKKKECNIVAIFQRKDTVQFDTSFNTYFVIFLTVEYSWDCTFRWRECNADEQRDAMQFGRLIFLTLIQRIRECTWSYYWEYKDTGSCLQCLLDKTAT